MRVEIWPLDKASRFVSIVAFEKGLMIELLFCSDSELNGELGGSTSLSEPLTHSGTLRVRRPIHRRVPDSQL